MKSLLPRGLKMEAHGREALKTSLARFPAPARLVLPLPGCEAGAARLVKPGDQIATAQLLSVPISAVPVSAPAGGTITDIRVVDLPLCGPTPCAFINCQAGKKAVKTAPFQKDTTPEAIVRVAEAAGIVDEFDGKPLYKKLSRMRRAQVNLLLACGVDDDMYASSAMATLRENPENVVVGLEMAAQAVGAHDRKIVVTDLREQALIERKRPAAGLLAAGRRYPARLLLLRRLRGDGKRPAFVGVQACVALAHAVNDGRAQTAVVVTVAGDGVKLPRNVYTPIGTPIADLLRFCDCHEPGFVYVGGAATGRMVSNLTMPVTANARCVTVLSEEPRRSVCSCIGCGKCTRVCPRGIMPWRIYEELQRERPDPMNLTNVQNCGGCAACSMVCPSSIRLAEVVAKAAAMKKSGDTQC